MNRGITTISLVLGLALVLIAGVFLGYFIKSVPKELAPKLPSPATKPIVFTQSSWGGSDKDLIAISALPPFEVLKTWSNVSGGQSMNIASFTTDDRYGYFDLGSDVPWIAKVDLSTLELKKIYSGAGASSFVLTPDEKYLYAYDEDMGAVVKYDTATDQVANIIRLDGLLLKLDNWGTSRLIPGWNAHSMLITPDGKYIYLTFQFPPGGSYGPPPEEPLPFNASTWKIDTRTDTVVKKIDLGVYWAFHGGSGMTPDGRYIYGAGGSKVWVLDTMTDEVIKRWDDGMGNHGVYMQPDGKYVWVSQGDPHGGGGLPTPETKNFNPEIWIIDTATNEIVKRIPTPKSTHWIEFTPDSKYAVSDADQSDYILIWDVQKQELIKQIPVGNRAKGLDTPEDVQGSWHPRISPDGKYAYINIAYADAMDIVDVEKGEVVKTIEVGPRPHQPQLFWPGYPYQFNWWTYRLPAEVPNSIDLLP